jgi:hypothetical protein
MTLPVLGKTWQYVPNYAIAATGTALGTNRTILKAIKDFLTTDAAEWVDNANIATTAANLWTVRYSCDSVAAGAAGDGVDRWGAITDLVWANAGVAHSWIVLRQTAIGATAELLISCENTSANGAQITVVASASAGFTGGTTTTRPTATDEDIRLSSATWGGVFNTDTNVKIHVMKSTDGECWRVLCCNAGQANTSWILEKAVAFAGATWTNRLVTYFQGAAAATNTLTNALLNTSASIGGRGVSNMTLTMAGMAFAGAQANVSITTANDLSSAWPFMPHQLASATASNRGLHGYLNDVWFGSTIVATGSTYPTTGTQHQFVQLGSMILPWCQVAIQVS